MKRAVRFAIPILCFSLLMIASSFGQDQYTEGTVDRVVLLRILPGHANAFWDDVKTNLAPLWSDEKSQGLIEGYQLFLNQTKANPEDWDVGLVLTYKNMAALDGLGMKVFDLRMKKFGSKSNEQQVINKRVENFQVVGSYLTRNVTLK